MRIRRLDLRRVVIFLLLSVALLSYTPSTIYGTQYDDAVALYLELENADEDYDYIEEDEYIEEPEYIEDEQRSIIEKTLDNIEIEFAVDYQRVSGEQLFTVVDSGGASISQLTYPIEGDMYIMRGEARFNPRLSLGIKYGSSNFSNTTSSDEDWNLTESITYQITEQDTESEMETFDVSLYWRLLDIKNDSDEKNVNNFLITDRISLDVFGGYHQQKGRYTMKDPITQYLRIVDDALWQSTGLPLYEGLYSSYKVRYSGPKLGLRCRGEKGRLSTGLSMAYAYIKTTAHGWWNLRSYSFTQKSTQLGHAIMLDANMRYNFYNAWYAGIGYNYMEYVQEKLKESGVQPGDTYDDLDIIRDVNNKVYGPYFTLGVVW